MATWHRTQSSNWLKKSEKTLKLVVVGLLIKNTRNEILNKWTHKDYPSEVH